jgi:hypothetical protein
MIRERVLDLVVGGARAAFKERFRRKDDSRGAIAALSSMLINERLLHRIELIRAPQPFERCDPLSDERVSRGRAGRDDIAVHDHRARVALLQPAAELRGLEPELVAQNVQKRGAWLGRYIPLLTIDLKDEISHCT